MLWQFPLWKYWHSVKVVSLLLQRDPLGHENDWRAMCTLPETERLWTGVFQAPGTTKGEGYPENLSFPSAPLCSQEGPLHRPPSPPSMWSSRLGLERPAGYLHQTKFSALWEFGHLLLLAIFASLQVSIGPVTLNRWELKSSVCLVSGDWDPLVLA